MLQRLNQNFDYLFHETVNIIYNKFLKVIYLISVNILCICILERVNRILMFEQKNTKQEINSFVGYNNILILLC